VAAPLVVDSRARSVSVPARAAVLVFWLAAVFTLLTAVMGAVVSATQSGAACPTWPGCFPGSVAPPAAVHPVIEFTHRAVATTAGPLILAAALLAGRLPRPTRWLRVLPWAALACAGVAAAVGRGVVLGSVPAWLGAVDLFCALSAMVAMAVAAVLAVSPPAAAARRSRSWMVPATAVAALLVMHPLGVLVAGPGSHTGTLGWPRFQIVSGDLHPWLQVVRMVLAVIALVLVVLPQITRPQLGLHTVPVAIVVLDLVAGTALDAVNGSVTAVLVTQAVAAVLLVCALSAASGTADGSLRRSS
jgi:cytochrome c oxidase assembly protein subunit 15